MKHKFRLLFAFVLVVSGTPTFSQTLKDFFSNPSTQLTYLGIDYTKNLLIKNPSINTSDIKTSDIRHPNQTFKSTP